jgi:hypothetical protein
MLRDILQLRGSESVSMLDRRKLPRLILSGVTIILPATHAGLDLGKRRIPSSPVCQTLAAMYLLATASNQMKPAVAGRTIPVMQAAISLPNRFASTSTPPGPE